MLKYLKNYSGAILFDDVAVKGVDALKSGLTTSKCIKLRPNGLSASMATLEPLNGEVANNTTHITKTTDTDEVIVEVRAYMTKHASPEFDFMEKWNNNIPMPLRVMVGTKVKETNGMVYMKLHGDIVAHQVHKCMKCGKTLTNPVSQYFGIGPECGDHNYVNPFDNEEALRSAVSAYEKKLVNIKWEGWIIKSAIISQRPFIKEIYDD